MPVEIRELVIRAVISQDGQAGQGLPARDDEAPAPPPIDMEQLVQDCVRQVLRALERDRER